MTVISIILYYNNFYVVYIDSRDHGSFFSYNDCPRANIQQFKLFFFFSGQEYVAHTKCITESERYGGQDYVAKPGQNKGERKQQEWINVVKNVIETAHNLTKEEQNILDILSRHENIPRKKAKFLNFIRSAMGNRVNMRVIDGIWARMETAFKGAVEANKPQVPITNGN